MKASELRQGSLIEKNNEFHCVASINADSTIRTYSEDKKDTYGCFALRIFKPIPLTHEWLLKFGFEENKMCYYTDELYLKKIDFQPIGEEETDIIFYKLEYVHQLQTLYFALTNEELTLIK